MKTVAYTSPYVPPEWIEAHGFRATRLSTGMREGGAVASCATEGMCSFADAFVSALNDSDGTTAAVFATTCDQMRRAADLVRGDSNVAVFLMDVPCVRRLPSGRTRYRMELDRLGRFLVELGGRTPRTSRLTAIVRRYETSRTLLRNSRERVSARRHAEMTSAFHRSGVVPAAPAKSVRGRPAVPLVILGGPLPPEEYWFLDAVERLGGRVVLDGTETGERTMPASIDRSLLADDPSEAIARAYFDGIRDVFQRPNSGFHEWLRRETSDRGVKGIVVRTYVWCDLWRAEVERIRETAALPLLHLDVDRFGLSRAAAMSRLQTFMETLK